MAENALSCLSGQNGTPSPTSPLQRRCILLLPICGTDVRVVRSGFEHRPSPAANIAKYVKWRDNSLMLFDLNNWWLIIFIIFAIALFVIARLIELPAQKPEYQYGRRDCIMTKAERKCFFSLNEAVGGDYDVFPQIHLPSILNHKINGQKWFGAFRHIDEKSVDFVLCRKSDLFPILAIELDDWSHERPERQKRDKEIERILRGANLPLLRLQDNSDTPEVLFSKISQVLSSNTLKVT